MRPIQMVDLYHQHEKIKDEIFRAIDEVIDSSQFIKGKPVKLFEESLANYLSVKHVITCANGTDALMLALMALELNEGDEIIVPTYTFIATAEVIAFLKLTPVFADVEYDTFNIDPSYIEKLITSRTRAIIPVHLFGQSANMDYIINIAKKHNLYVIEDAAQALGAIYQTSNGLKHKVGTIGDIGCTSFFPSKNLGCMGDGGAIFTNNDKWANKLRILANHGSKLKYYHTCIGINSRLDTIQAAILNVKLKYLDNYLNARKSAALLYKNLLIEEPAICLPSDSGFHTYNQFTIKVEPSLRNKLINHLKQYNIPTMIYYPFPLHVQPAFAYLSYKYDYPIAEKLSQQVLSLPIHTELSEKQIYFIVDKIKEVLK